MSQLLGSDMQAALEALSKRKLFVERMCWWIMDGHSNSRRYRW